MINPPAGVKLVMAAVCVMKNIAPEKIVDPAGTGQKVAEEDFMSIFIVLLLFLLFWYKRAKLKS